MVAEKDEPVIACFSRTAKYDLIFSAVTFAECNTEKQSLPYYGKSCYGF